MCRSGQTAALPARHALLYRFRTARLLCAALALAAALAGQARAGDAGPRSAIAQVRADARRLLARRVRAFGIDPAQIALRDAVVSGAQGVISWDAGTRGGVMGLVRYLDRWWDALDESAVNGCNAATRVFPLGTAPTLSSALLAAANAHNARFARLQRLPACAGQTAPALPELTAGAVSLHPDRAAAGGYDLALRFAASNAAPGDRVTLVYGRAPSPAEMLPAPAPPRDWGGPNDVFDFDVRIDGKQPVAFAAGSTVDIWFPFVLDDTLRYKLSFFTAGAVTGPLDGSLFDNTLHFTLPAFTMAPGQTLHAGIDGWY